MIPLLRSSLFPCFVLLLFISGSDESPKKETEGGGGSPRKSWLGSGRSWFPRSKKPGGTAESSGSGNNVEENKNVLVDGFVKNHISADYLKDLVSFSRK